MNKIPLFMNMTSIKTIAKIGSKEVNVKNHNQERVHVTAVIWIVANLIKLPRILVFKVKPFRRVEKIQEHPLVKIKQIFAYCQKSLKNESIKIMDIRVLEKVHLFWLKK